MSKNKLKKFAELASMENVFEFPLQRILTGDDFPLRGEWGKSFFGNSNPIVLELGCGRGEYTVGLARNHTDKNFIGIDIKGARMWAGATEARNGKLKNVAFVRTDIHNISTFFGNGEISEIWLTFPDPQMKKQRKRLTSATFLDNYRKVLTDNGLVRLKTDSNFLFTYTSELLAANKIPVNEAITDIYSTTDSERHGILTSIRTYYESQWLQRGITIKYIEFRLPHAAVITEIDDSHIPHDEYRSYGRQRRSELGI